MNGLRLIAINEALKGLFVLCAGLGVLEYAHQHIQNLGHVFTKFAGLGHAGESLARLLSGVTDQKILWLAIAVVFYSLLRFVEAYGLWKEQNWARWFGAITGGLYLPYEFYLSYHHFSWLKLAVSGINIIVVLYLLKAAPLFRSPGLPGRSVPRRRAPS